jgi:hypothetical protein
LHIAASVVNGSPASRQLELHALEIRDRLAELPALFRVRDGRVERPASNAHHLGTDADAPLIERIHRHLVALARVTKHVRRWHPAAVEQQFTGAARADPELVFLASDSEAVEPALDDEGGNAAIAG